MYYIYDIIIEGEKRMSTVTLRLPDNIVNKIDINAHTLHMSRSEYIKKAILAMNFEIQERTRVEKLMAASKRVRQESMKINAEFATIEHDPKA
jgi:metal-responsive CopG/Arc/MetJ family transcriptional regulator